MSKIFEGIMTALAEETDYSYDFLVDLYNETMEDDGDLEYFIGVTLERDW